MKAGMIIKNIRYSLRYTLQADRSYFLLMLIKVILNSVLPLFISLFPAYIIKALSDKTLYQIEGILIIFFLSTVLLYILQHLIHSRIEVKNRYIDSLYAETVNQKAMSVDLEQLESAAYMDRTELVRDAVNKIKISDIVMAFTTALSSILTMCGAAYIFSYISIYISLLFLAILIINILIDRKRILQRQNFEEENVHSKREMDYQLLLLGDKKAAKDIRIYNMEGFIKNKFDSKFNAYNDAYYATRPVRLLYYFACFLCDAVRDFAVYVYAALKFLYGQIEVSEFYLFTAAAVQMYSAMKTLFTTIIGLELKAKYIGYLKDFLEAEIKEEKRKAFIADITPEELSVEFCNVSFRYKGQDAYVLKNCSFTIRKGTGSVLLERTEPENQQSLNCCCACMSLRRVRYY